MTYRQEFELEMYLQQCLKHVSKRGECKRTIRKYELESFESYAPMIGVQENQLTNP